jgi:AraC-like DNA-binding protein
MRYSRLAVRVPPLPPRASPTEPLLLWPPLLATRGVGARSEAHAHHAMHLVVCLDGELQVRTPDAPEPVRAAGVLTAPDVTHAIDATGAEVLLVFLDPESDAGAALRATLAGPLRVLSAGERSHIDPSTDPGVLMRSGGVAWTRRAVEVLGTSPLPPRAAVHPRVRRALRLLREGDPGADASLDALAAAVGLSPGRFMHAFTASVGIPLRPYLAWLRLQRAAAAVVAGAPLAEAAHAAGFADAAHMSRSFRRMLGMSPSALRAAPTVR